MSTLCIQNACLVQTGESSPVKTDLLIVDGIIQEIGVGLAVPSDAVCYDAAGQILMPGLCDPHVHLREPGREDSETIASGTEAAIAGGYTRLLAMPNTDPPIDAGGMVTYVKSMAQNQSRIPVSVAGCLTRGRKGDKLAEIADMAAQGAVMMTDCNHALQDEYVLRRALEYTRDFDVVVGVYPDTPALSGEGVMHEGEMSFRLGLQGIPAMAEEIAIERELRVACAVGGRIHIQNVSTGEGVASIRRFKAQGLQVTAETTPHHLLLNHSALVGYHTRFKMMPPLRTPEDQEALLAGLLDGTLDMIATGHAPHTDFEKHLDFMHAPFGVTGLETALPALYTELVKTGKMSWAVLVEKMSTAPRKLLKVEALHLRVGERFEATLFDPEGETVISRESMKSRSFNSPWLGETLSGKVTQVFLGNEALMG
ncbi:dihydroorotase [Kiritimatiellota bacterium B12222]|nr:dihydroorotase [Kiritimatiellota bacterium B12222]